MMKFNELSETAKEEARDWFRENDLDYEWWEHVYEETVKFGKMMGIEIGTRYGRYTNGKEWTQPDIYFSLDDGCSFCGFAYLAKMKDSVARIKAETVETSLLTLAIKAEELYTKAITSWTKTRLEGIEDYIDADMRFSIQAKRHNSCYVSVYDSMSHCAELELEVQDFVNSFAAWIYKQLEAGHEYLTSNETVDENIRANDYLFDEFGSNI